MAYVVEKAGAHYAVIYEGTNPITGRERRRWHRCPSRADAEALAPWLGTQRVRLRTAEHVVTEGQRRRSGCPPGRPLSRPLPMPATSPRSTTT